MAVEREGKQGRGVARKKGVKGSAQRLGGKRGKSFTTQDGTSRAVTFRKEEEQSTTEGLGKGLNTRLPKWEGEYGHE